MLSIQSVIRCVLMSLGMLATAQVLAQTFMIRAGSDLYDAKIDVKQCTADECSGFGKITLYQKNTQKLWMSLSLKI